MGLAELLPQSYEFRFGGARICLRYDMTALLFLERCGHKIDDIFAEEPSKEVISAFIEAGFPAIGDKRAAGLVEAMGAGAVLLHVRAAVLLSLPEPDPLAIPETNGGGGNGETDYEMLRTLVCDVMKKDDEFFWHSTLRELLTRWQKYAIAKGYKKPPERIQMYDTEGM